MQQILGLDIVGFFAMPMPTQPLGWFTEEIKSFDQMKGLKYRTVGLAADLFSQMGVRVTQLGGAEIVPALERGVIDAFEFNNPSSDKSFGAHDMRKVYMMGSYHQAMEFFEIMFNKTKYESLPAEHQAILKYAAEAVSSNNYWKAMDIYSRDLEELQSKHGVKCLPHARFHLRRAAQGLGRADRAAVGGRLLQEGCGVAAGLGQARGLLRNAQLGGLRARLRASLRRSARLSRPPWVAGVKPIHPAERGGKPDK